MLPVLHQVYLNESASVIPRRTGSKPFLKILGYILFYFWFEVLVSSVCKKEKKELIENTVRELVGATLKILHCANQFH